MDYGDVSTEVHGCTEFIGNFLYNQRPSAEATTDTHMSAGPITNEGLRPQPQALA
jgi:hypothetical protein